MQHKAQRDAARHHSGCLLAQPEPCEYVIDTNDDEGDWKLCRIPDPDNPGGWLRLDEFRRRYAA